MSHTYHQPVLTGEVIHYLITNVKGTYVDCTLGGGGHSYSILQALDSDGFLIGLDADADAINEASKVLEEFDNKILRQIFYDQLDVVLHEVDKFPVEGFLFDLGLSSFHVDRKERGFSYQVEAPLDMRFDQRQKLTAAEVVNTYSQESLARVLREYGEEPHWRRIAAAIVKRRGIDALQTTKDLADIIKPIVGERKLVKSLSRVFQAIRIEVNKELDRLKTALELSFSYLREGGRLTVISYHSLEDRMVKEFFRYKALDCICPSDLPTCMCDKVSELKILTRHVVQPDEEEISSNPRARSARLRAAEKIVPFDN